MLIKTFDNLWQQWLDHHNEKGSDKELLFVVLLNNNFDWDFIAEKLQHTPKNEITISRKERQKILEKQHTVNIFPLYPILADNPYVHRYDTNLAEIYELENFITLSECEKIKEKINQSLMESTVTDPNADKSVRTSKSATLKKEDCPLAMALHERMHKFMRIPSHCSEDIQGHVYEVGQEYKPHHDFFDFRLEYNKKYQSEGQRLWTLMVYLDNVEEGGNTRFTKIDAEFKPVQGKALIWRNCYPNGQGNIFSEHWAMPVIKGKKTVITKWFREYRELK